LNTRFDRGAGVESENGGKMKCAAERRQTGKREIAHTQRIYLRVLLYAKE